MHGEADGQRFIHEPEFERVGRDSLWFTLAPPDEHWLVVLSHVDAIRAHAGVLQTGGLRDGVLSSEKLDRSNRDLEHSNLDLKTAKLEIEQSLAELKEKQNLIELTSAEKAMAINLSDEERKKRISEESKNQKLRYFGGIQTAKLAIAAGDSEQAKRILASSNTRTTGVWRFPTVWHPVTTPKAATRINRFE